MAITDKNKSTFERLQELKQLYESGILTKEEMEAEKTDILGQEKPHEEKPEQPSAKPEQPSEGPKAVFKGADKAETADETALNKKILIGAGIVLVVIMAFFASLSTCNGGSKDYEAVNDTVSNDTVAVDTISTIGYYTGMQAVLEKVVADNPTVTDFFAIPEISEAVQNEYGREFYDFLLSKIVPCKDMRIELDKYEDGYDAETIYSTYFNLKGKDDGSVEFSYDVSDAVMTVTLKLDGSEVNPDGTFALVEGSKWKLGYEEDEFGDPIESKAYVYVEGETDYMSSDLKIAVMKENENQVIFFHELPWSDIHDNHSMESIKIKDKNKGSVYEVKDGDYFLTRSILSEKDSRYIRILCDSSPSVSFSIRFDIMDYELFRDTKYSHTIFNFDNGRAYGLSNALNHYFHRAF